MRPVQLIILGIPSLSLLWWWADRRLRGVGRALRWLLSLAVTAVLTGFFWVIVACRDEVMMPIPAGWHALVLLWGLIFLPLPALPSMFGWSLWTLYRRVFTGAADSRDPVASGTSSRRRWMITSASMLPMLAT